MRNRILTTMDMRKKKMGIFVVCIILIATIGTGITYANTNGNPSQLANSAEITKMKDGLLSGTALVDSGNSYLIGTEVYDNTPLEATKNSTKASGNKNNTESYIPKNAIIKEIAGNDILPPSSIENFETINGTSPEIIMSNGSAVIFTQENLNGWRCKAGDKLTYEFEKYVSDVSDTQAMIIGYVLNEILYEGEVVKELKGAYQFEVIEDGEYYIYVISATSDYLALKEGTISIVSK